MHKFFQWVQNRVQGSTNLHTHTKANKYEGKITTRANQTNFPILPGGILLLPPSPLPYRQYFVAKPFT